MNILSPEAMPTGFTQPTDMRCSFDGLPTPPRFRRVIYTTNATKSLNYLTRKVLKNCGVFPNNEPIFKPPIWEVICLCLSEITGNLRV